jgi:homoserine/homoserine lactone efflux protein
MTALNPDLFFAFVAATTALILLPGPIVTLVIANAIAHGTRTGLATVAGASTGNAALVAAGALGLTAIVAVLSDIFEYLRWIGVAYLVWLGLRAWREALRRRSGDAPHPAGDADGVGAAAGFRAAPRARGVFLQAVLVAITNPKTILFYAAFFPQFIDAGRPIAPQLLIMSVVFVVIATTFDSCYALLAGRIRPLLTGERRTRIRHGLTGTLLMATGLGLAFARRGS